VRRVIVNGDDFGFSRGVNRAIIEAHERGILTSASLIVAGEAAEEAVALAHAHPHLAVGLHLVLVDGPAALAPAEIPHLVDSRRRFRRSPVAAGLLYQFGPAARRELRREIIAQLERFRRTGLGLSHVDGHHHLHTHPVVLRMLAELAPEYQIETIRLPAEELFSTLAIDRTALPAKLLWALIFGRLRRHGERVLSHAGVGFCDRVYGLLATGRITESYLLGLIPRIDGERVELYCHPSVDLAGEPGNGPAGSGSCELAALLSERVRAALAARGLALSTFRDARRQVPQAARGL
jgi:hopanoid biosynthesis associated protein HpnK